MHGNSCITAAFALTALVGAPAMGAQGALAPTRLDTLRNPEIQAMVARLDLEKYKATIKGLTQFGDRRQGTDRNRAAVDWIEAQLKSYGCTNTERITYTYTTPPARRAGRGGRGPRRTRRRRHDRPGCARAAAAAETGRRAARATAACARGPA